MTDDVWVPVEDVAIDDPALMARVAAVTEDDALHILAVLIEGQEALALVDPTNGGIPCYVPLEATEEATLTALLDMWDVMQSRPAVLN